MAERFRFRLETVRRLREQARDAQRRIVADASRAVRSVEDRIEQFSRELRTVSAESRDARRMGRLDPVLLRRDQHYRGWLQRKIVQFQEELSVKLAELDRHRAKLAETQKDLKVIEKLRDRQLQRHLAEVAREERLYHDEAAQQQCLRGRSGEHEVAV